MIYVRKVKLAKSLLTSIIIPFIYLILAYFFMGYLQKSASLEFHDDFVFQFTQYLFCRHPSI